MKMEAVEYEKLLKQAYRTAPIGLCFFDTEFRYRHINEWLASINGLSVEAHLGRTINEVIPNVSVEVESILRRVMETGKPVIKGIVEAGTKALPNQKRILQHSFHAIMADEGTAIGVSCFVQDITEHKIGDVALRVANDGLERCVEERTAELTSSNQSLLSMIAERKRMEEALRESESRFRSLFENSEVSIWNEDMSEIHRALEQLRLDGVSDLRQYLKDNPQAAWDMAASIRVIQVNEATLEQFGGKDEDQFLFQIDKTFGSNAIEVFIEELIAIWEHEPTFRAEANFRALDGRDITAIISFRIPETAAGFRSIPVSILDISERKRAEQALRESEERYLSLSEASFEGLAIHDQGTIIDVNTRFQEMFGYSLEELFGMNAFDLVAPEDRERVLQIAARGQEEPYEAVGLRKDSTTFSMEVQARSMLYRGRYVRAVACRDITERKRVVEALRVKTDQLQAVNDAMTAYLDCGNWRETSATILRSALDQTNSQFGFVGVVTAESTLRILAHDGIEWDDVIGRKFYEQALLDYERLGYLEFTSFENLFGKVITSGQAVVSNHPLNDPRSAGLPPGHPPLRHFLGVPILKGSEVVGLIGVANRPGGYKGTEQEDIEILCHAASVLHDSYRRQQHEDALNRKRKRAEKSRQESEKRFHSIFDHSNDAIFLSDTARDEICDANQCAINMLGYSREELLALPLSAVHPDKMLGLQAFAESVFERGSEWTDELTFLTKSGMRIPCEISASIISLDDRSLLLAMARDITNRKRAEKLQSDQRHVLELISRDRVSLTEVLETITRDAEDYLPGVRSTILLRENNSLRHGAAPSMSKAYSEAIDGMLLGPSAGSCGTAAYRKTRVVVEDIRSDHLWDDFRHLGEEFGFRACWSQPILDPDEYVLGTFALYYEHPGKPTDTEIHFIESMAHLAGIAIERNRVEKTLIARAETERLLLLELDHRVRNNLASLISLIDLSRSGVDSVDAFAESIKGRAQTIASVHSALSRTKWNAIELRSLLNTLMVIGDDGHITFDGPAVIIPPEQAQAVGLIAHELATNSRKYGALSRPNGSVEVSWEEQLNDSGERQVSIRWLETGGPPIETEPKPGTGMSLISGLVNYELRGKVNFRFPNPGADHMIAIPVNTASKTKLELSADSTQWTI